MDDTTSAAIFLDDLGRQLASMSPEQFADFRQYFEERHPGLTDQTRAAKREGISLIGGAYKEVNIFEADDWLRLGLLDTFMGWLHKKGTTCEHGPTPHAPQPTWSAAWKSGVVVCSSCRHLLNVLGDAARRCDCCGRVCAGGDDDPITTVALWYGCLAYLVRACRDCLPEQSQ